MYIPRDQVDELIEAFQEVDILSRQEDMTGEEAMIVSVKAIRASRTALNILKGNKLCSYQDSPSTTQLTPSGLNTMKAYWP